MNLKHTLFTHWIAITALILTVFSSALTAQEMKPTFEAEVTILPSSVSFDAPDLYESLSLRVGGPDGQITFRYAEVASSLSFDLVDDEGNARPDGLYGYELRGARDAESEAILLRSGYFSILEGTFVSPDVPEGGFNKDQQIMDDLIVSGSSCVGLDCVDGETFELSTLKLKENNARILFQDTSASAQFPTRDWMLRANEISNGGADLFSIVDCNGQGANCETSDGLSADASVPFIIEGGAPDNALYVDTDGDVGVGTSLPAVELHVLDGDTPTVRLEQDGSAGFSAQTWDLAGNEANFFIRDLTNGNTLPFKILPGAANDSLVVAADGDVGLGTRSPGAKLDVRGDIALTGTVDGRDVAADGSTLDAHVADFNNPHQVTAEQVGAISQATLDAHTGDFNNPHQVTAEQVGAISQTVLDAHTGDFNNPHQVTAAQTGADSAGTAAAAIAAHEAAFNHNNIPSALPVPVAQGGTGATDAATARANLGISADETKNGVVPFPAFAGSPATATVTFDSAFAAGTSYSVALTALSNDVGQPLSAYLVAKDEAGFTIALDGSLDALTSVDWLARPAPAVTQVYFTSPADGDSFELGSAVDVNFFVSNAAGVRFYLDGVAQGDFTDAFSFTPAAAGSFELRLEAIDANGVELGASATIQIDVAVSTAGVSCTLGETNVWNTGYTLNFAVTNDGSETIDAWAVVLDFAEPTTISNSWNAELTLSGDGLTLDATNASFNGTLAPGASASFGFQGSHDGSFELPACSGN